VEGRVGVCGWVLAGAQDVEFPWVCERADGDSTFPPPRAGRERTEGRPAGAAGSNGVCVVCVPLAGSSAFPLQRSKRNKKPYYLSSRGVNAGKGGWRLGFALRTPGTGASQRLKVPWDLPGMTCLGTCRPPVRGRDSRRDGWSSE
jgi:hypothetical protein